MRRFGVADRLQDRRRQPRAVGRTTGGTPSCAAGGISFPARGTLPRQADPSRAAGGGRAADSSGDLNVTDKPFSESCVQNREPILAVLRGLFADRSHVLEVGSGTGQHAVYFGAELTHLRWQTADVPQHHAGIRLWLAEAELANVLPPIALDVSD